jgi:murein DD-endopeptidase MepM/ murein hydrolase activator NlpD
MSSKFCFGFRKTELLNSLAASQRLAGAMIVNKVRLKNILAWLLWSMIAGYAIFGCATSSLRTVTPPTAPPDISYRMVTDTPQHRGITIGGPGFLGHEIVTVADGVVVFVNYNERRGNHIKILHGPDSNKQDLYTEHFHVHGRFIKEGDKVERGQTIGLIGLGNRERTNLPHYHYIVIREESPGKFIALEPSDYWFGIDQYKEKRDKGLDIGPFAIACFDPTVNYPKEPIRFTYPVKCK